jgi:hypothetical protein
MRRLSAPGIPIGTRTSLRLLACAAIVTALAACAANERQVSMEYSGAVVKDKTLALIGVDSSRVVVKNPRELSAAFPRTPAEPVNAVLAKEFSDYFCNGLAQSIEYAKPVRAPDSLAEPPEDQRITFARKAGGGLPAFAYRIPTREYLHAHGIDADLVLVVNALQSSQYVVDIVAPKVGGTMKESYLVVEGWYMVWDYDKNKPVAYGRFRPSRLYKAELDTGDWMMAFDRSVRMVMESSPFRGPNWYRKQNP